MALIASDGDYVPLVRKLNALGTRVMVLGWDFEYVDDNGNERYTATSGKMMNEVTYPVWMHKVIDGQDNRFDASEINALFVPSGSRDNAGYSRDESRHSKDESYSHPNYDEVQPDSARGAHYDGSDPDQPMQTVVPPTPHGVRKCSRILQLKTGMGSSRMNRLRRICFSSGRIWKGSTSTSSMSATCWNTRSAKMNGVNAPVTLRGSPPRRRRYKGSAA